ncbi:MAG: thioredoxin [Planctomycetota bacterium]|nr:MAG: thioredoxin [Planctomycetota bacterium]
MRLTPSIHSWLHRFLLVVAAAVAVGASMPALSAAEPEKPASEADVEIPAPVYVNLMLARDPAVHAELGLDAREVAAVEQAIAKVDAPLWRLRDVPVPRCADQLAEHLATLRQGLDATLSPEQMQRFEQLVIQARGAKALVAPDVRERLSLSADQQAQFKQLVAENEGGTLDAQKIMAVLSPQQQAELASLFGKRFDLAQVTYVGCGEAPELRNVQSWINSDPLSLEKLRGKVVVVHFWAFGCINCIRNLPHYQAWHEKFPESEVAIIGLHTPETSAERDLNNLRANVKQREIEYPVAFDAEAANWQAWGNNFWPAVYLIDREGRVRYWWYGELNWEGARGEETMRKRIEQLMAEK